MVNTSIDHFVSHAEDPRRAHEYERSEPVIFDLERKRIFEAPHDRFFVLGD